MVEFMKVPRSRSVTKPRKLRNIPIDTQSPKIEVVQTQELTIEHLTNFIDIPSKIKVTKDQECQIFIENCNISTIADDYDQEYETIKYLDGLWERIDAKLRDSESEDSSQSIRWCMGCKTVNSSMVSAESLEKE